MDIEKRKQLTQGKSVLKNLRVLLGNISQEEFARRIEVALVTVSRWERGIFEPTLTLTQAKNLERELQTIGLTLLDLPDTLGPIQEEEIEAV